MFALGAAYLALYVGVSVALLLRWAALHRQADGHWHFFWIIPPYYVRNYFAAMLLPPLVLIVVWLIARVLSTPGIVDR